MAINVYFSVPQGATVRRFVVDGTREKRNVAILDGRRTIYRTIGVKPQQDTVLSVDLTAKSGQTGTPNLRVTPGVRSTGVGRVEVSSCFGS